MDAMDNPTYFALSRNECDGQPRKMATTRCNRRSASSWAKHNLRSMVRSVSEDTDLLVMGKPRMADIASSLPACEIAPVHAASTTRNLDRKKSVGSDRSNTLPNKCQDRNGKRRHSIGSFLLKEKSQPIVSSETKTCDTKTTPAVTNQRRYKKFSWEKVGKMRDELDIVIVISEESETANIWQEYLLTCFQQISKEQNKPPFKVQIVRVRDFFPPDDCKSEWHAYSHAKLQIVIICPSFALKIKGNEGRKNILRRFIRSDKVIAMLLGVERVMDESITKSLPNYDDWRKLVVKNQDQNFVGDLLGVAMDVISRSWHMREALAVQQKQNQFSVLPKKLKVGQNRLIVLLNEALSTSDIVKVFLEKGENRVEVSNVVRRNPYTLQLKMPGSFLQFSALVRIDIEKNGESLGSRMVKCESQMSELEQLLRSLDNPLHFLCQSVGINTEDLDTLDKFLVALFQYNLPPHFSLLRIPSSKYITLNEEYPTILHFAANYGLERFCWLLVESPGGEQACHIKNINHYSPPEMAEKAGHVKVANLLRGFVQMSELSSVYNYLKRMPENAMDGDYYSQPRSSMGAYMIPPSARPINPSVGDIFATSPDSGPDYTNFKPCRVPVMPDKSQLFLPLDVNNDYKIPRGNPVLVTPQTPTLITPDSKGSTLAEYSYTTKFQFPDNRESSGKLAPPRDKSSSPHSSTTKLSAAQSDISSSREKLSAQDELLEIMNDFKNNVFTISEVEQLVESWQNRNDVQQSFREKQDQLNQMREEYEKIQRRIKEQLRRPTPFDKIRKFFGKGSSGKVNKHEIVVGECSSTYRPASSVSLQSSSSGSSGTNSISSCAPESSLKPRERTVPIKSADAAHSPNYTSLGFDNESISAQLGAHHYTPMSANVSSQLDNKREFRTIREVSELEGDYYNDGKLEIKTLNDKLTKLSSGIPSVEVEYATVCKKSLRNPDKPFQSKETRSDSNKDNAENFSDKIKKVGASSCEILCTEATKCIANLSCNMGSSDNLLNEVTYKFVDQVPSALSSSNVSECDSESRKNSSLDLSSLNSEASYSSEDRFVNSPITEFTRKVESQNDECTLQFDVKEENENENKSAPPLDGQLGVAPPVFPHFSMKECVRSNGPSKCDLLVLKV